MPVNATTRRSGPYTGDGLTTSFGYGYLILSDDDLQVLQRDTVTGAETILVKGSAYTVTGVGLATGGTVVLTAPLAVGKTLTIIGDTSFSQPALFDKNSPFDLRVLTTALDRIVIQTQQLDERLSRALVQSPTDPDAVDVATLKAELLASAAAAAASAGAADTSADDAAASAAAALAAELANIRNTGNWVGPGTSYKINDLVQPGDGQTWYCKVAHVSSAAFSTDNGLGRWGLFAAKGSSGAGSGDVLAANAGSEYTAAAATFRANIGLGALATKTTIVASDINASALRTSVEADINSDTEITTAGYVRARTDAIYRAARRVSMFAETKPNGNNAGGATAGAWFTREMDAGVDELTPSGSVPFGIPGATIDVADGGINLPIGLYEVDAVATISSQTVGAVARLRVSGGAVVCAPLKGADVITGLAARAAQGSNNPLQNLYTHVSAFVAVTGSAGKVYLEQRVETTQGTYGKGSASLLPAGAVPNETYAYMKIKRID